MVICEELWIFYKEFFGETYSVLVPSIFGIVVFVMGVGFIIERERKEKKIGMALLLSWPFTTLFSPFLVPIISFCSFVWFTILLFSKER